MIVDAELLQKTDSLLGQALRNAGENDIVRAVMLLGEQKAQKTENDVPTLDPSQFDSHSAYRQALIGRRKKQLGAELGSILARLRELDLATWGGELGRTVVIEGSASQILQSLKLSGVRHASLDQELPSPRPCESRPGKVGATRVGKIA